MQILKQHSHKQGLEQLTQHRPHLVEEIREAIESVSAPECLTKITKEQSKINRWGGLLFSPPAINAAFKTILYPQGWASWINQRYVQPRLKFANKGGGIDRFREMDGLKERVGLEIQMGKYAFMGYDVFSKMVIFRNQKVIDFGIEIVLVQEMIECMSTGVSAFEHLMIDFEYRGEADIDVPVWIVGIGATPAEWAEVQAIQDLFRHDPEAAKLQYPQIGKKDLKGTIPGPK